MNQIEMRKKYLDEYKIVIFDLDGTLYFQKPFRVRMLLFLAGHALTHPGAIRDLLLIKKYREVRENWEECGARELAGTAMGLDEKQYAYVARQENVSPDRVKRAVSFFMLEAPLKLLPSFKDEALAGIISALHKKNVPVIVYSDYPAADKLNALAITADACYTSADERINSMKPDPKGIRVILQDFGCNAQDALMIGDRYEKDGLAAKSSGVDYIIVSKKKKERETLKILANRP